MTNYGAGRRFEWRVKKDLERRGYPIVMRSAGSKGKLDLIAVPKTRGGASHGVLLIQAKGQKPTKRERLKMEQMDAFGLRVLAWRRKRTLVYECFALQPPLDRKSIAFELRWGEFNP